MRSKNDHAGQQNWLAFHRGRVDSSLPVSLKVAHDFGRVRQVLEFVGTFRSGRNTYADGTETGDGRQTNFEERMLKWI